MNVVICGGGIIGSSCAYYLAKRNIPCTIIEQEEIACAASGKAGGFLARNWCESKLSNNLVKLSYNLHMDLAKIFDDVGYRCVNTHSTIVDNSKQSLKSGASTLTWLNGPVTKQSLLDTSENTAQVHPKKLCQQYVHEAQKLTNNRTTVLLDKVIGIEFDSSTDRPTITGVSLQSGSVVRADTVVIAMGPWTSGAVSWFPKNSIPKIGAQRAHSIVIKVPDDVTMTADCLFLEHRNDSGVTSNEMYPRPDGTVYLCGDCDGKPLPNRSSDVEVENSKCTELRNAANTACSNLEHGQTIAEQACYLPMSPDDIPVIGLIDTVKGAYIASGHSCWGILNSTGTGYVMAELIATGECKSLDLKPFDPKRFN